jgi:hypothetical protein
MNGNVDNRPQVPELGFGRPRSASEPTQTRTRTQTTASGPDPASGPAAAVTAHILNLSNPATFIMIFTFLSPLIIVASLVGMSFWFQNFKGFIYLGFLTAACLVRQFLFAGNSNYVNSVPDKCNIIDYKVIGNNTFSIFVMTFTFFYICFPMFVNNSINWWLVASLLFYMVLDGGVKFYTGCLKNSNFQIMMDILLGFTLGALIVSSMYFGGSGKYLFFNEVSTDKEVCSVSKNNTFKCSVYKNGELLGSV